MLPDFGWSELLVIAIVLIVIVGPKDLPSMLRTFGKTTSSLRKMAGDFRRQFDDALKEAELDDVRQIASDLKGLDPRSQIKDTLNPLGKIGEDINSELKKATKDVEKSDKPKTEPAKSTLTADNAKAIEAASDWADDLKPKPEAKAKTASKAGTKTRAPAKSAAAPGAAKADTKKTATTKSAPAKAAAPKATASKRGSKSAASAAKPKAPAAPKASAAAAKTGTKTAAKPKAATKTTGTAGKDQS